MVFGLNVRPEWGYYPAVEVLDGDLSQVNALNPVNDGGAGWSGRSGGVPVDGTHLPKRVKWNDPRGNPVPDFDQTPMLNVSERARQLIESVEPKVHQFFPVEYLDRSGRPLESRFWFVICNRIDSLDREHTTMVLRKGRNWRPARDLARRGESIPSHIDPNAPSKMVFSLKQIGGAHIWRDKHLDSGSEWISDTLAEAFRTAGLTGIEPSMVDSV